MTSFCVNCLPPILTKSQRTRTRLHPNSASNAPSSTNTSPQNDAYTYCDKSPIELMLDEKFGQSEKKAKPDVQSKKNQYYIKAVKANRPDAIRQLFSKGTSKICPNCFERFDRDLNMRRGVVYYAMQNLYDSSKSRSDALECLELVCSLDGVDVNADTWYTPFQVGPPLWTAIENLDTEVFKSYRKVVPAPFTQMLSVLVDSGVHCSSLLNTKRKRGTTLPFMFVSSPLTQMLQTRI
jgi:hypothetical protein